MLLAQLQKALLKCQRMGEGSVEIGSVTTDSRQVQDGSLFIAIRGYTVDGHSFVGAAQEAGAGAVMVERAVPGLRVPQLVVPDTRRAAAIVADCFYGHPSRELKVIGVTGTNGKTTVTHLLEQILQAAGYRAGLLGTIGKRIAGVTTEVVNTTPEAVELQATLAEMVAAKCDYAVMEVSSHALELGRVAGVRYRTAVHTNLTQDHLDFHETMERYQAAKGKLFSRLGNTFADSRDEMAYGVLNADDGAYDYFAGQLAGEFLSYGIEEEADVRATDVLVTASGVSFHVHSFAGDAQVQLQLTGRFNVYNALAAICVALVEGISLETALAALESIPGIPGRLERVPSHGGVSVLVDYSHTPDSLKNALETVREFAGARVITVAGCGGDRDKSKRPLMAQVATQYSDLAILTSDNPRTEDPKAILDDMEAGLNGVDNYRRITDRREAIHTAISLAHPDDVVLIAGKGHENYQIIGRTKIHFDDREVAAEALAELRH